MLVVEGVAVVVVLMLVLVLMVVVWRGVEGGNCVDKGVGGGGNKGSSSLGMKIEMLFFIGKRCNAVSQYLHYCNSCRPHR